MSSRFPSRPPDETILYSAASLLCTDVFVSGVGRLGAARTLDRELNQCAGGRWGLPFWVPDREAPERISDGLHLHVEFTCSQASKLFIRNTQIRNQTVGKEWTESSHVVETHNCLNKRFACLH